MSARAPHEHLSCSFCGKSPPAVRRLVEGGCRHATHPQCVFICEECVTFCAQVLADGAEPHVPVRAG